MGRSGARKENCSTFAPDTGSNQSSTDSLRELFSSSIVTAPTGACALAVPAASGEAQSAAIISSDTGFMPDLPRVIDATAHAAPECCGLCARGAWLFRGSGLHSVQ